MAHIYYKQFLTTIYCVEICKIYFSLLEIFTEANSKRNNDIHNDDIDSKKAEVDEIGLDAKIETKDEKNNQKESIDSENDSSVHHMNENKISNENDTKSEEADNIKVQHDKNDEGKNEDKFKDCTDGSKKRTESEVDNKSDDISKTELDSCKSELRVDEACNKDEVFQNEKTNDCDKYPIACQKEATNELDDYVEEQDLIKKSDDNLSSLQSNY